MKTIAFTTMTTPVGEMIAGATDDGLCLFDYVHRRMHEPILRRVEQRLGAVLGEGDSEFFEPLRAQLDAYFEGTRTAFELPLVMSGTPFEERVWRALMDIPYGEVRSYGELAAALGQPTAVRAVARANGANCLPIIVPCHRVVGHDGRLTGYSGGLRAKRWLLELERGHAGEQAQGSLFDL